MEPEEILAHDTYKMAFIAGELKIEGNPQRASQFLEMWATYRAQYPVASKILESATNISKLEKKASSLLKS